MVEEFYRGMIEDMRAAQEKTRESYEKQLIELRKSMQCTIDSLTAQMSALAANGRVNAGNDYSGINVPLVAVCNVPPVAQCNVPPQKWLQ